MIDIICSQNTGNVAFLTDEPDIAKATHITVQADKNQMQFLHNGKIIKDIPLASDTVTLFITTSNMVMNILMKDGAPVSQRLMTVTME